MAPARPRIHEHLARLYPGYRVAAIEPLAPDAGPASDPTSKLAGYGKPARVSLVGEGGVHIELVWRVASADDLGHDRRSDRAAETLLAFDDFAAVTDHVPPLDVGAIRRNGELVSLRDYDELYLITGYAPGVPYANDLRRIAEDGGATDRDAARVDALARYLAALHVPVAGPARYRRAIRDLVGTGEGVFGVIDNYPADVPGAPAPRLAAIEHQIATWRWRLRDHEGRLSKTHGDFHPFNIVFDGDRVVPLDASRGTCGDPVDDITALSINYILFALDRPSGWRGLGPLWHRLWQRYTELRPDPSLAAVAPPFFAWRALVVCNPVFYPNLSKRGRDALLGLAECALAAGHLVPAWADEVFR